LRFALEYSSGWYGMAELCRCYEISRETGYKWWKRFQESGAAGLEDESRAPLRHPNQMAAEMEAALLELRRKYPRWGPKKLRGHLELQRKEVQWPVLSTIGALLKREGLAVARKQRRRVPPYTQPLAAADEPNKVWCGDFKGWFKTRDGERIDPLTLTDACSRYLLRCQTVEKTDTVRVRAIMEAALREFGLPGALLTDNGPPFASRAIAGLSPLAVYLMKLDIVPMRIQAGHPEQNGRHERMHRTLKAETVEHPAANRRDQQRAFDRFRQEYNEVRPHEALGQQTPASRYHGSAREYPARLPEPEYDSGMEVRKVRERGQFSWKGHRDIFLTETLSGERIGLQRVDDRYWQIYFCKFPIGRFDSYQLSVGALPQEPRRTGGAENIEEGGANDGNREEHAIPTFAPPTAAPSLE